MRAPTLILGTGRGGGFKKPVTLLIIMDVYQDFLGFFDLREQLFLFFAKK